MDIGQGSQGQPYSAHTGRSFALQQVWHVILKMSAHRKSIVVLAAYFYTIDKCIMLIEGCLLACHAGKPWSDGHNRTAWCDIAGMCYHLACIDSGISTNQQTMRCAIKHNRIRQPCLLPFLQGLWNDAPGLPVQSRLPGLDFQAASNFTVCAMQDVGKIDAVISKQV